MEEDFYALLGVVSTRTRTRGVACPPTNPFCMYRAEERRAAMTLNCLIEVLPGRCRRQLATGDLVTLRHPTRNALMFAPLRSRRAR